MSDIKERIAQLEDEIENFEIDPDDYTDQYDAMLDEYDVNIGSLSYSGSYVLKEIDPTAYRCGLLDFVDSFDLEDDPKYQALLEELEELQEQLDEE